ncbi:MAG: mechanosensitive ion channel family protein [Flavobacteriales bacterium]|nr:mechanosensitive ion channel family protein [Flavobacteriales bacterium]
MEDLKEILAREYFSNSLGDYLQFVVLVFLGILFSRLLARGLERLIYKFFEKGGVSLEKFHELLKKPLSAVVLLIFIYVACEHITFPESWNLDPSDQFGLKMVLLRTFQTVFGSALIWVVLKLAEFVGLIVLAKAEQTDGNQDDQIVLFAIEIVKIAVVITGFFFLLGAVFKVNIATLIAGLGVGGLALALAAKESVENLLASFIIFLDKPFIVGDLITVDGVTGSIEKVGFRSTRLRTLDKTYVTVPNRTLVTANLDNLSARSIRRAKFNIGLTYSTSAEQIMNIKTDIQKILDDHSKTDDSGIVKFTEFGDSSLNLMIVFHINSPDWEEFLEVKEEVNFKIMEIVEKHKSDFAFPTRTLHLINEN